MFLERKRTLVSVALFVTGFLFSFHLSTRSCPFNDDESMVFMDNELGGLASLSNDYRMQDFRLNLYIFLALLLSAPAGVV